MLAELIGKSGVLMGPADEGHPFALLGPVGTVVMSDRPTFRWRALGGADSYVVRIYDADFNEVAVSPRLSETAWTVTRSLERVRTYSWQVTARVGDKEVVSPVKPSPEARFMTLDRAKADELAEAKNASAGSHLTLCILYAQAGLLDDASLAYIVNEKGASNIWLQPLSGERPRQLTNFKSGKLLSFAWSRDGQWLAYMRNRATSDVVLLRDLK